MGTNKRYAHRVDQAMEQRLIETFIAKGMPLLTLPDEALQLDVMPLTIDPQPKRVRVWVQFGPNHCQVDARLTRWTTKAAGVEFEIRGKQYRCWVWGDAVQLADAHTPQ